VARKGKCHSKRIVCDERGDFIQNPQGLNLLFGIPGTVLSCLFLFFGFYDGRRCLGNTPKHRSKKWSFYGIFCEERSGGVAAIGQPPQDGNGT